jgi:hypothetical protein
MIRTLRLLKNSNQALRFIGVLAVVVTAHFSGVLVFAASKDLKLTYLLPKSDIHWVQDLDTVAPEDGFDRYFLSEDPSIDILLSFSEDDNFQDLVDEGLQKFIAHISRGKNIAQSLVSDDPIKLDHVTMENELPRKKISYETEYKLATNRYSTFEVIYLYPKSGLHATLRWRQDSSLDILKKSREVFSGLDVRQKAKSFRE